MYSPFSIGRFYHGLKLSYRWDTKLQLVLSCLKTANVTCKGPYNCVGKALALMEIRSVTSSILRRYDVGLAPGQTKEAFVDGLVDGFTAASPTLDLVFTPRE